MKRLLVLVLMVTPLVLAETSPLAIPHFADGGGWRSSIAIFNTFGVDHSRILVNFRNADGRKVDVSLEQYGTVNSLDIEIPVQSSVFLETTGLRPTAQTGWIEIEQRSGSTPVRAYAVFRQSVPGRPDYEAVAPGMRATASMTFAFDNTQDLATAFAVVNLGISSCTVGVSPMYDEGGNLLATQAKVFANLAANGHTALVATDRLPELAGKRGYLRMYTLFGCSGGIAGLGLRFNSSGPFTNLTPLSTSSTF